MVIGAQFLAPTVSFAEPHDLLTHSYVKTLAQTLPRFSVVSHSHPFHSEHVP